MKYRQTGKWPWMMITFGLALAWFFAPTWEPHQTAWAEDTVAEATDGFDHGATDAKDAAGHGANSGHGGDAAHGDSSGHAVGNTNPVSVDPDLTIFTAAVFLMLLAVLTKFAWGPIRDALEARERGIEEQLAEARRSAEESKRLLDEHEAKLATTASEVRAMLEGARKDADHQKSLILAEAQAAAQTEKDRAVREIDAAKNNALEQLAKSSVDTAVGLAGKIIGRQLNQADHASLIQDALHKLPSEN